MHRIPATPGGWTPETDGVIIIEQTPAPLIFLSAADTDLQTLASAVSRLPVDFPEIRAVNLLQLQQQFTIDEYASTVLEKAQVIILRLLGGRAYWSYGLEVVKETVERTGASLIVIPGDDSPDPELISHSTLSLTLVHPVWRYFTEGGIDNFINGLKFIAKIQWHYPEEPAPPQPVPKVGVYHWLGLNPQVNDGDFNLPPVGILFYRAHYLAGNTDPIDVLCQALWHRHLKPIPLFISSWRDPEVQLELLTHFQSSETSKIKILLNTTSFSVARIRSSEFQMNSASLDEKSFYRNLNVPVFQVIFSSSNQSQWESTFPGLSPRDVAMNVALPEVDGRIISRVVSVKSVETWHESLETNIVRYQPILDRIKFVADLTQNWVKLQKAQISERRIAIILANYPTGNGRLANGVGLDTPASCIHILQALKIAGYSVENISENGNQLIQQLTAKITNDPESFHLSFANQFISLLEYQTFFQQLPESVQISLVSRWGLPENSSQLQKHPSEDYLVFPIAGIEFGNIFVGIQPARGYDLDPTLNYHAPDLEPTHYYLAFYLWLRQQFQMDAIIHLGKHGNLEWLPGKSVGLSQTCYPEIALGAIPNFYPFIVNDPGEGSQAKRRAQAVILDHLTPPMTRAELYGPLEKLEHLIDEYYQAESLDPRRLKLIEEQIQELIQQTNLTQDLAVHGLSTPREKSREFTEFLTRADGYLCELKEAQIRDGLHIFGQCPQGEQLRDLMIAISRHPQSNRLGLTRALAQDFQWDFDPLTADPGEGVPGDFDLSILEKIGAQIAKKPRIFGDLIEILELYSGELIDRLISGELTLVRGGIESLSDFLPLSLIETEKELNWIAKHLLPALLQTEQEITNLLKGLNGDYVESGASGAPTRGRPDVLPTGRNFYSVDIRALPTETAWRVGAVAAERLIERYTQENGEYPKTLGLSVWGTATMRTGGDDIAEALALLGVKPVWDGVSRRVIDFEILPLSVLGRPRVDVTLRISGFFRDAFANLIDLFDQAVIAVSQLPESRDENPLAAQVQADQTFWQEVGLTSEQAITRAQYRIFGSKPGAYGAGLQGLIEAQNWVDDQDLATAYLNWSSYAYSRKSEGVPAPEVLGRRLENLQIVLQNQDNREHDLLDSDDYYQFQGGLTVAVRALTGKNPQVYFGDHALPENPKIRHLEAEISRVYRSRVINPKWIAGVMRHGYKGAFEMSATVDYLFAYDATTHAVADFMYAGVAEAYLLDETVQKFIQTYNPWVLRDMAERLLEAHQRGLWESAPSQMIEELRILVHQAEGVIEGKM